MDEPKEVASMYFLNFINLGFKYFLTRALYLHVLECKWFILSESFGIGPSYRLSWKL